MIEIQARAAEQRKPSCAGSGITGPSLDQPASCFPAPTARLHGDHRDALRLPKRFRRRGLDVTMSDKARAELALTPLFPALRGRRPRSSTPGWRKLACPAIELFHTSNDWRLG